METSNSNYLNVLSPDDIAEVKRAEAHYQAGLVPCGRELVVQVMGTLATAFPNTKISDREADAKLELYCRSLEDLPADALLHGVEVVLKTQKWFPTVAEIREAAAPVFEPRRHAALACRRLILKHDREYSEDRPEKTDWTRAEVEEANAYFRRVGLTTRYRLDPKRPGLVESYTIEPDQREAERNQSAA